MDKIEFDSKEHLVLISRSLRILRQLLSVHEADTEKISD